MPVPIVAMEGPPSAAMAAGILSACREIFGSMDEEKYFRRLRESDRLLILVACDHDEIAGFKIGYQAETGVFYSWIGGVRAIYRRRGIARSLLEKQHAWCEDQGFRIIRTKTYNRWKNMLILNLQHGFDITGTRLKEDGSLQIMLEKRLDGTG